ncbi:riboflavin synthase [Nocardioides massiliensis]|uniref:Riboflavin synthase n=1 Tax=Nocardioides massiliensis TaxID=1325935 RepID=A0ABT9NSR0_9ACTN|nr:riboflavin synthase [Nocardioides massiliensis]MDP9822875.1 riboflavin synthase [Nocardioides massiliensis]
MFTGIVEELGTIDAIEEQADAIRLTVRGPHVVTDATLGDSIAVNGCCLTVAERSTETFTADVMRETLTKTTLGTLEPGSRVNLERAVTPSTRLGGHIVQGHVDGTGTVLSRTPSEHWELVEIALPPTLVRYLVPKGSITVDGVSLTVVDVHDGDADDPQAPPRFTISLIPETLARTTLGSREPGERVNLEVDVLAKYIERLTAGRGANQGETA